MGIANFRRDRKKTISIVASLSLGGVILLVTASILLVRSPERIARQYFPDGDYKIYIHSEKTEYEVMAKGNPLNEALRQEVLAVDVSINQLCTFAIRKSVDVIYCINPFFG